MLTPLRRCPASLPRALRSAAASRTGLRNVPITSPRLPLARSRIAPLLSIRAFQSSVRLSQLAGATTQSDAESQQKEQPASLTTFAELAEKDLVHRNVIRAISEMGLERMTDVQSATIKQALEGTDIIAQAKTGTGKTVGFLLPMLQNILEKNPTLAQRAPYSQGRRQRIVPDIRGIVISPTRELAEQIAVEAQKVAKHTGLVVRTAVGGTGKRDGMRRIMHEGCNLLVATPGRLNDILSDPYSPIPVDNLDYLVLDEADRLLETGFWEEITSIQEKLPDRGDRDRQTLMFSATVPKEVVRLVRQTLKPGFHFVRTVREDEEPTHHRVPQNAVVCNGLENQLPALIELFRREAERSVVPGARPFKAIVYFNTMKEVQLAHQTFNDLRRTQRRENHPMWKGRFHSIHADLSQASRQRSADAFRAAESGVLLSTDVTARGMDFPNVTHVIQVGLPRDRETYIHRIGRTGRAGKEGEGWLLLPRFQEKDLRYTLDKIPIRQDQSLEAASADLTDPANIPDNVSDLVENLKDGFDAGDPELLANAYQAVLASYGRTRDKHALFNSLNTMAKNIWGMKELPAVADKGLAKRLRESRPAARFGGNDRFGRSDRRGGFDRRGGYDRRSGNDRSSERPRFSDSRSEFPRQNNWERRGRQGFGRRDDAPDRRVPGGRGFDRTQRDGSRPMRNRFD